MSRQCHGSQLGADDGLPLSPLGDVGSHVNDCRERAEIDIVGMSLFFVD